MKLATMPLMMATFTANVTHTKQWLTTTEGMLCGAISDEVPEGYGGRATGKDLWTLDIDTDGDGQADAISIALEIEAKVGIITGMTP